MKKSLNLLLAVLLFFLSISFYGFQKDVDESSEGPDHEVEYFKRWHGEDVGNLIPSERLKTIWDEIHRMPNESSFNEAINNWTELGPTSMLVNGSDDRFTGRVLDINIDGASLPRIASASGGLWSFSNFGNQLPYSLSSTLTSQVIGSFDIKPGNSNFMIVGTGEWGVRNGTGVYITVLGGTIFTKANFPAGDPGAVFKVRFDKVNTNIAYIATDIGLFKSTNSGYDWVRYLTGTVSDFEVNPNDNNMIYAGVVGQGLLRSTDAGFTWGFSTGGLPNTNVGRVDITIPKFSSNYVYVSMAKNSDNTTLGVYRTTNSGSNWVNVTPSSNFLGSQGWYDNVISVNPVNANIVIAGGVGLWRSVNGGNNWTQIIDASIHPDQHSCIWGIDGSQVWVGNDGGITVSTDEGLTWSTAKNILPITQYLNVDIGRNNTNMIIGGSQDNGLSVSVNGGISWIQTLVGDGGGVAVDPTNSNKMYSTIGLSDAIYAWRRVRSTDAGQNWTYCDTGFSASTQWYTRMRTLSVPSVLYSNAGNFVYRSFDQGSTWSKFNTTAFPGTDIGNISAGGNVVYAALNPGSFSGQILRVYDGTSWNERSTGLPVQNGVRSVKPHPYNPNTAYAVMFGLNSGNKVFKTTNTGITWTNISGNLPNVPMGDIIPYPNNDNLLYVGTEMGCYKSTNAGANWYRWNNGLPEATIVTEMAAIDSIASRGKFYVVAGTFGNSMYKREISGDDPNGISVISSNVPKSFSLKQNYPNPFNPVTNINFEIPEKTFVNITVFDLSGKEVQLLVNHYLNAGEYKFSFNASSLSTGIYFYRINAGKFTETKKMILIK